MTPAPLPAYPGTPLLTPRRHEMLVRLPDDMHPLERSRALRLMRHFRPRWVPADKGWRLRPKQAGRWLRLFEGRWDVEGVGAFQRYIRLEHGVIVLIALDIYEALRRMRMELTDAGDGNRKS